MLWGDPEGLRFVENERYFGGEVGGRVLKQLSGVWRGDGQTSVV